MAEYPINKGVEFKGLKSQYLFIFCGGLLAVFVVFIVLFMACMTFLKTGCYFLSSASMIPIRTGIVLGR